MAEARAAVLLVALLSVASCLPLGPAICLAQDRTGIPTPTPAPTSIPAPISAPDVGHSNAVSDADGEALRALASRHFEAIGRGVARLGVSDAPWGKAVLEALHDGRLAVGSDSDRIVIRENGVARDAVTGATLTGDALRRIRVNNRIRGAIRIALAERALRANDVSAREAAAMALYHHPGADALPVLDRAMSREKAASVKRALTLARAAIVLKTGAAPGQERAAVETLGKSGRLDARGLLAGVASSSSDPEIAGSARKAVASIDRRQRLWGIVQNVFYGASLGSVLMLAAMGLAVTFGVMGVINMAHGELMMIGAYATYATQYGLHRWLPGLETWSLAVAVPVAFGVCWLLGIAIEKGLIRFLYGRPLETLLATWGLSLCLQQLVRSLFGPTNVAVTTPSFLSGSVAIGGTEITIGRIAILVFSGCVMAGLLFILRRTRFGLQMRAVTQNRRMAALMGIRTARVDALTFGLGSGIAGLAGVAVSQIDNVSPNLGQGYIIDSFLVVVFGGVGNLWGTLAAAMTLGIGDKVLEPLIGAVSGKILLLVLVILYIQKHPRGMFPLRGRGVDS
ncbi:urea ABC transporter permease subunit UrtB [Swaminathania salitolerans]|uniref:Branched-chain amino acid ABC transporter permease n=1 Tax=Swaminathania salitolerans TaxID=182838 RepID=A0A511BNT5_9PROT|nr:urea ABC transporter permease subunit UrtB [Swaminathania salitolerans]GBQ13796.1 urea short-chain amide or branched-chain amino acid transporter permease [Swaminathania salitolerans LMG 21291]GEL01732.1 branched-chain amino acid ABC transporter permease [Swaminathania salitolerans]